MQTIFRTRKVFRQFIPVVYRSKKIHNTVINNFDYSIPTNALITLNVKKVTLLKLLKVKNHVNTL